MLPVSTESRWLSIVTLVISFALFFAGLAGLAFALRFPGLEWLVFGGGIVVISAAFAIPMHVIPAIEKPVR